MLIANSEFSNTAVDPAMLNMSIHEDNFLGLKALANKFSGQVKCICIDPSYNVNAANR